ncbi:hypothetical protein HZA97_04050 [Candidatus Woesearchaeota archaeon]|nr:hypothetical protein [Candidatus Woesearchaeota archaeon]
MRDAFSAELCNIAEKDSEVIFLTGDIGYQVFDNYVSKFPDRFFNMGVAEASMITTAAGLAHSGKKPFVYTIIPFLTMRAYEQIRVDVCINNHPLKIVGVGGGVAYGHLGPTHHATEDVAIMRALPNMTVIVPSDPSETRKAVIAAYQHNGPVYVRLGKNKEPDLKRYNYDTYQLGKAAVMREGKEIGIISCGPVMNEVLKAADELSKEGLESTVLNMHTIKPLDVEAIKKLADQVNVLVSVEEHNIIGGLGSAVSEVLAESGKGKTFRRLGIRDTICHGVGSQEYHYKKQGINAESIKNTIKELYLK